MTQGGLGAYPELTTREEKKSIGMPAVKRGQNERENAAWCFLIYSIHSITVNSIIFKFCTLTDSLLIH